MEQHHALLEGLISVRAALSAQSREIHTIYVARQRHSRDIRALLHLAAASNVPVQYLNPQELAVRAEGHTHGGVIAVVGPRKFAPLHQLLSSTNHPFIVMLDGIKDPYNLGYAIRAFYAAGVTGLVVRARNWLNATTTIARASAGTCELLPIAEVNTVQQALGFMRGHSLTTAIATQHSDAISIYDANLAQPLFLLLGGEKRGLQRKLIDQADLLLAVPYGRHFPHALSAAATAAIISFERMRQCAVFVR